MFTNNKGSGVKQQGIRVTMHFSYKNMSLYCKRGVCRPDTIISHKISINDQKNQYFAKKNLNE